MNVSSQPETTPMSRLRERPPLLTLPDALVPHPGILPGTTTATGPAKLLLGVDGGATKTLAAVLDTGTYRLSTGVAGPSNPHSVGFPSAISAISEAVGKALRSAGIEPSAISAAVLGVASVDTDEDRSRVREGITALHAVRPMFVVNDVVAAGSRS